MKPDHSTDGIYELSEQGKQRWYVAIAFIIILAAAVLGYTMLYGKFAHPQDMSVSPFNDQPTNAVSMSNDEQSPASASTRIEQNAVVQSPSSAATSQTTDHNPTVTDGIAGRYANQAQTWVKSRLSPDAPVDHTTVTKQQITQLNQQNAQLAQQSQQINDQVTQMSQLSENKAQQIALLQDQVNSLQTQHAAVTQ